jgi:hypothetical protein
MDITSYNKSQPSSKLSLAIKLSARCRRQAVVSKLHLIENYTTITPYLISFPTYPSHIIDIMHRFQ